MTANAKPSWMPTEMQINHARYMDRYNNNHTTALISRAALDARIEMLKSLQGEFSWPGRTYDDIIADRLAALRAEREALP